MDRHEELDALTELLRRKQDGELEPDEERRFERLVAEDAAFAGTVERALQLQRDLQRLPEVEDPGSALTDRIMAALPVAPGPPAWHLTEILRRPVPVPLWLMAAAGLAVVLGGGWLLGTGSSKSADRAMQPAKVPQAARCQPQARTVLVRFSLAAPQARQVTLVGDFNAWSRDATTLLDSDGNGVWSVSIPLPPGRYQYKFLVDGQRWVVDPDASAFQPDGFGGRNSLLSI